MALPRLSPFSCIVLIVLLYEIEETIQFPTTIRLLENSVCQRHYASIGVDPPVDEALCKKGSIQHRLATIRGWYSALSVIPVLLLGPLYSHLAERMGRRPVLALVTAGMLLGLLLIYIVCSLWAFVPTELVMLIFAPRLLGGGPFMAITLHAAMVADLCDDNNRSQALYRMFCFKLAVELVVPQFASLLISHSLWLPYLLCGLSLGLTLPVMFVLPETGTGTEPFSWHEIREILNPANLGRYRRVLRRTEIQLVLLIAFVVQLRYNGLQLLPPYVSVCYGWTISQTARLLSVVPGISLVLYLALPQITDTILRRYEPSIATINRAVLRIFCSALLLGMVIITVMPGIGSFIPGLAVFSIGFNIRPPILAILATYVETTSETVQIYTLMAIVEGVAHLVGSPALESIWGMAVEKGPVWYSLPFWVLTGSFALAGLLSIFLPNIASLGGALRPTEDLDGGGEAEALLGRDRDGNSVEPAG